LDDLNSNSIRAFAHRFFFFSYRYFEQGVVYLFGMVSRELGFYIEAVQQGFPDCEGRFFT